MWGTFDTRYRHVSFVGGYREPEMEKFETSRYLPITVFAAEHGMSINDGYFARPPKGGSEYIHSELNDLKKGKRNDDTLYIFRNDSGRYTIPEESKHFVGIIDGYKVLAPNFMKR